MRFVWVVGLVVGCGSLPEAAPDMFDVDGQWPGRWVVGATVGDRVVYEGKSVSISDGVLSAACPGGDGSVTMARAADGWRWAGSLKCAPVTFRECGAVAITVTSVWVFRQPSGWLANFGEATGAPCGTAQAMWPSFGALRE